MARIFIDGFESGNLDCWDEVYLTTPNVITGANVASGIYALDLDWNGQGGVFLPPTRDHLQPTYEVKGLLPHIRARPEG